MQGIDNIYSCCLKIAVVYSQNKLTIMSFSLQIYRAYDNSQSCLYIYEIDMITLVGEQHAY